MKLILNALVLLSFASCAQLGFGKKSCCKGKKDSCSKEGKMKKEKKEKKEKKSCCSKEEKTA